MFITQLLTFFGKRELTTSYPHVSKNIHESPEGNGEGWWLVVKCVSGKKVIYNVANKWMPLYRCVADV